MAKRGRNLDLIDARDKKILERFIYWTEEQRLRSDDALRILSCQEFYLSEQRILKVLNKAYNRGGKRVQVVFHQPKPPKLNQQQRNLLQEN